MAGRADLKSDLLQELDRQKQIMVSFRNNPEIDQQVLVEVLRDIEHAHAGLYGMVGKIGQHLRENEWLMSIKQRTGIPGGACEFDLPSYHFWLHRDAATRLHDLTAGSRRSSRSATARASCCSCCARAGSRRASPRPAGRSSRCSAGGWRRWCGSESPLEADCVPEISANKYALNIRFVTAGADPRPRTCEPDVEFELTFCTL